MLPRAALTLAVIAATLLATGGRTASQSPPDPLESLTPRQLAGQRIVCGFPGTSAPATLRQEIAEGELAGVILFARNIRSTRQVAKMTAELQATARRQPVEEPVLISVDQEGGQVYRLPGAPRASAETIGRRGPAFARSQGAAVGRVMRAAGVNVDLAPVLDVKRRGGFIDEQDRSFSTRPARVASVGAAFTAGLQSTGVAATAKHFPGLGSTRANTDLRASRISLPAAKLRRIDESPYAAFSRAGGKLVMVGSAAYPKLGATGPAAQTRAVATGELRGRLGFAGVTITDSLEAEGAQVAEPREVAVRVASAGVDLLLYSSCATAVQGRDGLVDALASGRLDRAEFLDSVRRALTMRAGLQP